MWRPTRPAPRVGRGARSVVRRPARGTNEGSRDALPRSAVAGCPAPLPFKRGKPPAASSSSAVAAGGLYSAPR
eukprot:scaffold6225_cov188-Prasinococcus_capsulatus_cf.AAC.1